MATRPSCPTAAGPRCRSAVSWRCRPARGRPVIANYGIARHSFSEDYNDRVRQPKIRTGPHRRPAETPCRKNRLTWRNWYESHQTSILLRFCGRKRAICDIIIASLGPASLVHTADRLACRSMAWTHETDRLDPGPNCSTGQRATGDRCPDDRVSRAPQPLARLFAPVRRLHAHRQLRAGAGGCKRREIRLVARLGH